MRTREGSLPHDLQSKSLVLPRVHSTLYFGFAQIGSNSETKFKSQGQNSSLAKRDQPLLEPVFVSLSLTHSL